MEKFKLDKKLSNQCWIPKKKNLIENTIESNSWFDQKTSISSEKLKFINTSSINFNNNYNKQLIKSKQIQLFLNYNQQIIIKEWFKIYRYFYNQTVLFLRKKSKIKIQNTKVLKNRIKLKPTKIIKVLKKSSISQDIKYQNINFNKEDLYKILKKIKKEEKKNTKYEKYNQSFYFLRKTIKNSIIGKNKFITNKISKYKMPIHIIDNAIKDVTKAIKSGIENIKAGNIKFFRLRYKKETKNKETIVIEGSCFSKKQNTISSTILGDNIKSNYSIQGITRDSKLCYNKRLNTFILHVPINIEKINIKKRKSFISLDPGIRTFQTGYSDNKIEEIGVNCIKKLKKQIKKINIIKRDKGLIKKYYQRIKKIQNKVVDLHWKTINFLCKNYDTIMIGKLSTKSIISKKNKLPKIIKEIASYLSHFTFRCRLIYKCRLMKCNYLIVDESYTSKTCGKCGIINQRLGKKKIFNCRNKYCDMLLDRDINGARNIFLKNIKTFL